MIGDWSSEIKEKVKSKLIQMLSLRYSINDPPQTKLNNFSQSSQCELKVIHFVELAIMVVNLRGSFILAIQCLEME